VLFRSRDPALLNDRHDLVAGGVGDERADRFFRYVDGRDVSRVARDYVSLEDSVEILLRQRPSGDVPRSLEIDEVSQLLCKEVIDELGDDLVALAALAAGQRFDDSFEW